MRTELKDFERQGLFEQYHAKDNPFLYVTTKVDITNIYNKCKKYYATIAYFIAVALNDIDNFKYRYEDGKIYKYDKLNPNFTQMFDDKNIGYFTCQFKDTYAEFIKEYCCMQDMFQKNQKTYANEDPGEVWCSYVPWYNFSSILTPFDKRITIPQFIWDKFSFENDKTYINLSIMAHHGFVDGYHVGLFIEKFNYIIENLDSYL